MRNIVRVFTALAMVAGVSVIATSIASATQPDPLHKVTICHRTNSVTHPYVRITVDEASVDGDTGNDNGNGDHFAEHQGPVFDVTADTDVAYPPPHDGDQWGDVIPPFYSDGQTPTGYESLNWDDAGRAIFDAGCKIPNETETTFLVVQKNIPDVVEGSESITLTFTLTLQGDPGAVVGTCDITFTAGETQDSCQFDHLTPGVDYTLYETDTGGFDAAGPWNFTGGNSVEGTTQIITNTFTPASAEACKVTSDGSTGYVASGDTFTFNLLEDGVPALDGNSGPVTVTVNGGGTAQAPNCASFDYDLIDNHAYTVTEDSATGWTQGAGVCTVGGSSASSFTPQYPDDADASFSCTFTNSIDPAKARVCKVTNVVNGYGFDPSAVTFTFHLNTGTGSIEEKTITGGGTAGSPKCATFTTVLQQGVAYTITEDTVTGWTMGAGQGSCSFTPSYPGDSGQTFTCTFTNTKTFRAPLTPGYWRNHLAVISASCPSNKGCSANGPFTITYLPQTLGSSYVVTTTAQAAAVFDKMNCSNTGSNPQQNQNAVGCLAGHLLATKLNLANGADGTCISATVTSADALLSAVPYTGPGGTYTAIGAATRNAAITLKNKLDKFNNALGCS